MHAPPDPLRFIIEVPAAARRGEPVPIILRLINESDRAVEAYFLGRTIAFDIVITRDDGTIAWRRLEGVVVQGILQVRTLHPRETLEWREVWRPDLSGHYRVQGVLPSDQPEPRRTPWVTLVVR